MVRAMQFRLTRPAPIAPGFRGSAQGALRLACPFQIVKRALTSANG